MSIEVGIVRMVNTDSIEVSDRTRKVMGDLDELEQNLKENGLISPIAVKDLGDNKYQLLAGERRFTVLTRNEVKEIPVRIFDHELSELEMKIIEKSENLYRKDMEYWEMDQLTLDIHKMQQDLHGKKFTGTGTTGWGLEDTGNMIGNVTKSAVSTSIKRAELREAMPNAFDSCKTASDATKLMKKMDEAVVKQSIAEHMQKGDTSKTFKDLAKHYIIKDFFEGVKDIPSEIMHLVEIDPPYGINIKNQKQLNSPNLDLINYTEVDIEEYAEFMYNVFKECYRVMAEHSWLICWFAPEPWMESIYDGLIDNGFKTTRMCGIWTKPIGQSNNPEIYLSNNYEMFFYARKGNPVLNKPGRSNIFEYAPVYSQNKVHPTERPVELTDEIYDTFAFPGSRILIPFLGSGNGIISAHNRKMSAVGFELNKGYKDSYLVRINALS